MLESRSIVVDATKLYFQPLEWCLRAARAAVKGRKKSRIEDPGTSQLTPAENSEKVSGLQLPHINKDNLTLLSQIRLSRLENKAQLEIAKAALAAEVEVFQARLAASLEVESLVIKNRYLEAEKRALVSEDAEVDEEFKFVREILYEKAREMIDATIDEMKTDITSRLKVDSEEAVVKRLSRRDERKDGDEDD